ncbi:FUSC family protein [Pseudonocardia benzenivorans]
MANGSVVTPAAARLWHAPSAVMARHDPGYTALRRAVRVTVAACVGFYVCHLVIDDDTMAIYALFAAVALGALSEVTGAPATRTRGYGIVLVVGAVLVTAGTLVAGSTAAAVAGMLVFGFAISYSSVAGPRVGGVANGLQLFYVLACFPPFAPEQLGERLAGLAIGVVLLAIADRTLLPAPAPPDPARRIGVGLRTAAGFATAVASDLRSTGGTPAAATGGTAVVAAVRRDAQAAADALRLADMPLPERPLGCGLRDRSLFTLAAETRLVTARLGTLTDLLVTDGPHPRHPLTADLLDASAAVLEGSARTLQGGAPPPLDALDTALGAYLGMRVRHLPLPDGPTPDLRAGLAAAAVAQTARNTGLAAHGIARLPVPPGPLPDELRFLRMSRFELVRLRLANNVTPRSVYLQNALRVAIGLGVARLVAGVFDLSHGFWVLLATLSLMRTSAVASRSILVKAFVGTLIGAAAAAAVLTWVHTSLYAWLLPFLMIAAFAAGPAFGVAAGQAGFTLVVSVLFAQLDPATWQLAAVRLQDVVTGGVIGALIGAVMWPRGGGGELRRLAADSLRAGADELRDTVRLLAEGTPVPTGFSQLRRLAGLLNHSFVQYRGEPPRPGPQPDWLTLIGVVHRLSTYSATLRQRHPPSGPLPWPETATRIEAAAAEVALSVRGAADALDAGQAVPAATVRACHEAVTVHAPSNLADDVEAGLRVLDAWAWLTTVVDDLDRLTRLLSDPAAPTFPAPAAAEPPAPPAAQATQERSAVNPTEIEGS